MARAARGRVCRDVRLPAKLVRSRVSFTLAPQANRHRGHVTEKPVMLQAFAVLLTFQCLGEGVSYLFGLPVPGPVIGMLLLFGFVMLRPQVADAIEPTDALFEQFRIQRQIKQHEVMHKLKVAPFAANL